ncbi:MAG: GNAT family N-acetyltransferase [Lachnospiraceae bacterium]|nr:GNAT family N-acetyltransferase [Lachnospiraceae bacterium]
MAKIDENARVNIETDITFRELRNYLSIIDRLSICMLETLNYNNYICLEDVPDSYDDYYVYGISMIESEFYKIDKYEYAASGDRKDLTFINCIEIMLSEEPKSVWIKRDREMLITEHLMLCPSDNARDNVPFLKMLRGDGDFRIFSGVEPTENNVLEFQNYFEREKCCFYAIFLIDCQEEMIGYVGISYRGEERTEAEFYVSKAHRGQGYCTEALHKICEEVSQGNLKWRDETGEQIPIEIDKLYATTISDNLAAVKVLEKCGFVENREMVLVFQIFIDPDDEDKVYDNEISDYVLLLQNH